MQQIFAAWQRGRRRPGRAARALRADAQHRGPRGSRARARSTLLRAALAETRGRASEGLRRALATRLVLTLVNAEQTDEALARLRRRGGAAREQRALARRDRARGALEALSDARVSSQPRRARLPRSPTRSRATCSGSRPSPSAGPTPTTRRCALPANGKLEALRAEGVAPQRWVLRDARGRAARLGNASRRWRARASRSRSRRARRARPAAPLARTRAAGRRPPPRRARAARLRRLAHRAVPARARRAAGASTRCCATGHRAVLDSDPPLTAAALESIVWPERESGVSLRRARSPARRRARGARVDRPQSVRGARVGAARERGSLRDARRGRAQRREPAARARRHPRGPPRRGRRARTARSAQRRGRTRRARSRRARSARASRELATLASERDAHLVHAIAAELDAAAAIAREREVDFFALRVEPLDILTHAHFAEAVRDGQDDGAGLLFSRLPLPRRAPRRGRRRARRRRRADRDVRPRHPHRDGALARRDLRRGGRRRAGRAARPGARRCAASRARRADLLGVATRWPDTGVAPFASGERALASRARRSDLPARP